MGKSQRKKSLNNRDLSTSAPVGTIVSPVRIDFAAVSADIELSGCLFLELARWLPKTSSGSKAAELPNHVRDPEPASHAALCCRDQPG